MSQSYQQYLVISETISWVRWQHCHSTEGRWL